jgi:hypothetical protein
MKLLVSEKMKNAKKNVKKLNNFIIKYDSYNNNNYNDHNEFQYLLHRLLSRISRESIGPYGRLWVFIFFGNV